MGDVEGLYKALADANPGADITSPLDPHVSLALALALAPETDPARLQLAASASPSTAGRRVRPEESASCPRSPAGWGLIFLARGRMMSCSSTTGREPRRPARGPGRTAGHGWWSACGARFSTESRMSILILTLHLGWHAYDSCI